MPFCAGNVSFSRRDYAVLPACRHISCLHIWDGQHAAPERRSFMDTSVMFSLTYGLFVVTAREGDKDNGCITRHRRSGHRYSSPDFSHREQSQLYPRYDRTVPANLMFPFCPKRQALIPSSTSVSRADETWTSSTATPQPKELTTAFITSPKAPMHTFPQRLCRALTLELTPCSLPM